MNTNTLLKINLVVFSVVAILHLWRAIAGLDLNIGTFNLPKWASYIAFASIGYLAYLNYKAED